MQPVDPNKLFEIFQQGDETVFEEHGMKEVLDSPYVLMGMVVRGVENFHLMDVMYSRQYPKEYKRNRNVIAKKYFFKLFNHLKKIKAKPVDVLTDMEVGFDSTQIVVTLDFLRDYFEKIEHYEKCALIKTYIDASTTVNINN